MARSTVRQTAKRIRRQLHSSNRHEANVLSGTVNDSTTTIVCALDLQASLIIGAVIGIDLELMRVTAYNTTSKELTVIRGWHDSEPASHTDGALIEINPRFSLLDIYDAMIDEMHSWGPNLYRVVSDEFTLEAGQPLIELPVAWADCIGIIACRYEKDDGLQTDATWPDLEVRFQRGTTEWSANATGSNTLRVIEPTAATTVFVMAALGYAADPPELDDDLEDLGIESSLLDILVLGTKLRLVSDAEWGRSARQAQDDARRAEETPVGSSLQTLNFQQGLYRSRLNTEAAHLNARYPIRWK